MELECEILGIEGERHELNTSLFSVILRDNGAYISLAALTDSTEPITCLKQTQLLCLLIKTLGNFFLLTEEKI